jgi:hypothetical protein
MNKEENTRPLYNIWVKVGVRKAKIYAKTALQKQPIEKTRQWFKMARFLYLKQP